MTFIDNQDDNPFRVVKSNEPDTSPPPSALSDVTSQPTPDPFKRVRANSSVVGNKDADPEAAAKSLKLGKEYKTSPELIDVDQKAWEEHLVTEKNINIADNNPAVQGYLANNPMAAKVSKDDLGVLDTITRFIKDGWAAHQAFNPGFNMGKVVTAGGNDETTGAFIRTMQPSLWIDAGKQGYADFNYAQMLEQYRTMPAARSMLEPQIQAYQAEQQNKPKDGANAVQRLLAGFVGQFIGSIPSVAQYGTYGMTTGAAAGGMIGGPPGAATGMLAGLGAGVAAGFVIPMATGTAGQVYYAIKDIEGLSESTKQMISMGSGLFVGAIGAQAGPTVQGGVATIIKQFAGTKEGAMALNQFAQTFAKYSAEGAVVNGGQVLAQLLAEQFAKTLGTRSLKTIFNDNEERKKFLGDVAEGVASGAAIGGFSSTIHLIPGRGTRMGDTLISNKTLADANRLDELMKMSQESKTKDRFPGMFAEALKQEHDPDLFIDPQVVKDNKNAFSFVPDLEPQLAMSATLGTEIKVPQSDFLAHMPPEIYALMRDKVRQGGDALTPAEAQAIQLAMQKADEQLAQKAAEAAGAPLETPPAQAPETPMSRDALMGAIFGEHPTPSPEAMPQMPSSVQIPGLPEIKIPPAIAAQAPGLIDRLLGRRTLPTQDQITARIIAENEARVRANIKAPVVETPIEQAQVSPTPEALSVSNETVTEQTPGRLTESPPAEAVPPVTNADEVVKKGAEIGSEGKKSLLEELKALAERAPAKDVNDAILLNALKQDPRNLAELRSFIRKGAETIGADSKDVLSRLEAAVSALSTKLTKDEGAAVVHGLTDPDAKGTAIATAQVIDSSRHVQWLKPLFDGTELGPADRAAYNAHLLEVQQNLTESVFDAAREVTERKESKLWGEQAAAMRPAVEKDILAKPIIMADEYFRTGDVTALGDQKMGQLAREEVDTMFSSDELRSMGVKGKKLSLNRLLSAKMFGKGDSVVSADLIASAFGYPDGKTMMKDLITFRQSLRDSGETPTMRVERLINEETNTRMIAEHGKLDDIIEKNALKAAHNFAQDKVFGAELKELSRLSGKELMKAADVKKIVDDHVQDMTNAEAGDAERYRTLAGKHGRNAQAAKDIRDFEGALEAKQDQVKATLMARHAVEIAKRARQTEAIVAKYADKPRVEAVSPEFNTRILQLINGTGLEIKGRTPETLTRDIQATKEPSYTTWANNRHEKFGEAVPTLSYLNRGDPQVKSIAEMTVSNTKELNEAIRTLEQLGKTDEKRRVGNQLMSIEDIRNQFKDQAEGIDRRYEGTPAPKKSTFKAGVAGIIKVETLFREGDRGEENGILHRAIMVPIKKAQDAHWLLRRRAADFLRSVDHGEWALGVNRLTSSVPNTTMKNEYGTPHKLNRGNMLMVALNWGTEEGRALMSNTLNTDVTTAHDWLMNNMTKKNWDFVENVWRMYDGIIVPEMDKAYRTQRGFGMEKPEGISFIDGFKNNRRGGYFPLIRERNGSLPALKEAAVFDNRLFDSLPSQSQRQVMKEGKYALSLDFDQLPFRISEQVHSLAYRDAVRDISKLFDDDGFMKTFRETFGNEKANLLQPWIKDIANDGGRYDNSVAKAWQWAFGSLLKNAVQSFTGYNLATALVHSPSAASNTFGELRFRTFRAIGAAIGDSYLANMAKKIVMSPENAERYADFAWKNSVELRSRWRNSDNDIRRSLGQWGRLETLNYYAEWWGQSIISYTDYMTATVAWHGGYQKAIDAGLSHEEAVQAGDRLA